MQNKGVDPNLMAMLTNASKNQDAWGGNGYGNGFGRLFYCRTLIKKEYLLVLLLLYYK